MSLEEYAIESNEFQPLYVRLNGVEHLTGVEFAVKLGGVLRPTIPDFAAADGPLNGHVGVMTGGKTAKGVYYGWARVTDVAPEAPFLPMGPIFRIT
jgi:hypothetical protein